MAAPTACSGPRPCPSHSQATRKAKSTSEDATTPAAVADRYFKATSERKKGANDPITMFHSRALQNGTDRASRFPLSDTVSVKIAGSMVHHPLKNSQNTVANDMVQKATAIGEVLPTSRSPITK